MWIGDEITLYAIHIRSLWKFVKKKKKKKKKKRERRKSAHFKRISDEITLYVIHIRLLWKLVKDQHLSNNLLFLSSRHQ